MHCDRRRKRDLMTHVAIMNSKMHEECPTMPKTLADVEALFKETEKRFEEEGFTWGKASAGCVHSEPVRGSGVDWRSCGLTANSCRWMGEPTQCPQYRARNHAAEMSLQEVKERMPRIDPHGSALKQDRQLRGQQRWLKENGYKTAAVAVADGR